VTRRRLAGLVVAVLLTARDADTQVRGDLAEDAPASPSQGTAPVYDGAVVEAVKRFQARHVLDADVHFVGDIYGHDRALDQALARGFPYPEGR
jgi:murein L,D-transpeptidase YcbB/YkuD